MSPSCVDSYWLLVRIREKIKDCERIGLQVKEVYVGHSEYKLLRLATEYDGVCWVRNGDRLDLEVFGHKTFPVYLESKLEVLPEINKWAENRK